MWAKRIWSAKIQGVLEKNIGLNFVSGQAEGEGLALSSDTPVR